MQTQEIKASLVRSKVLCYISVGSHKEYIHPLAKPKLFIFICEGICLTVQYCQHQSICDHESVSKNHSIGLQIIKHGSVLFALWFLSVWVKLTLCFLGNQEDKTILFFFVLFFFCTNLFILIMMEKGKLC